MFQTGFHWCVNSSHTKILLLLKVCGNLYQKSGSWCISAKKDQFNAVPVGVMFRCDQMLDIEIERQTWFFLVMEFFVTLCRYQRVWQDTNLKPSASSWPCTCTELHVYHNVDWLHLCVHRKGHLFSSVQPFVKYQFKATKKKNFSLSGKMLNLMDSFLFTETFVSSIYQRLPSMYKSCC